MSKHPQASKVVLGYCRVSTEEQALDGHSLAAQRAAILQTAAIRQLTAPEILVDAGVSGKTINRPAFQSILARVRRGEVYAVIFSKLDRMTRSVGDLATLVALFERYGVAMISVNEQLDTSTAAGRMMVNMLGVFAQWEREQIAERVTSSLTYLRKNDRVYSGRAPLGYHNVDGNLVAVEGEQKTLQSIRKWRSQGLSYNAIADKLNAAGVPPRPGAQKWHQATVHKVMHSKKNATAFAEDKDWVYAN
jgi:site-specific DNA recombinase